MNFRISSCLATALTIALAAGCSYDTAHESTGVAEQVVAEKAPAAEPAEPADPRAGSAGEGAAQEAQAQQVFDAPTDSEERPAAAAAQVKRDAPAPRRRSRRLTARKKSSVSVAPVFRPSHDAPAEEASFRDYGVNERTSSRDDRFSTFSIDVDTGSYTIARRKLNEGQLPPAAAVRVEEFVNYFTYDYPSPDRGAFSVHLEAAPSPFGTDPDTYLLRVGVQGKRISHAERKPVHLTFLVDVSGSMNRPNRLPLAKRSLELLTKNLREGDTVAIATYAGRVAEILKPTGMEERGKILSAIESLESGGGTGMSSGMELAYKLAMTNFEADHVNRVIVLSDGDANIGPRSHEEILQRIRHFVEEGVTMSTIGFGMGNYKDTMMEQLANKGNGNYYYIDSFQESRKVFGEQLDGTLQVIAKDVKIQVEFDPEKVEEYRLIGYENRDIADRDFRDDQVDAGEIGAGHTVTAFYEIKLARAAEGRLAAVRVRHKKPQGFEASESEFWFRDGDVRRRIADASKDFQFAASVVQFAEILRESPYARDLSLDLVYEVAQSATSSRQKDRQEFLALMRKAKRLKR